MKVIKAVFFTIVITLAVLIIEPIRFFVSMASLVIIVMVVMDTIKDYRKTQREKVSVKRK